jgi:signal transduction histidine kinase
MASRLATAVGVLDDAISDLRQNLGQLHASAEPQESLRSALEKLATDPRFSSLVDVALDLGLPDSDTLSPERAVQVLAIVQEAFANIVRHAHAQHITIAARRLGDHLRLTIQDDGIGIPAHPVEGHGMQNMQARAALLHGSLAVERIEKGTCVTLDIPWKVEQ